MLGSLKLHDAIHQLGLILRFSTMDPPSRLLVNNKRRQSNTTANSVSPLLTKKMHFIPLGARHHSQNWGTKTGLYINHNITQYLY